MSELKSLSIVMIEDDLDLCQGWEEVFDILGHKFRYFPTARGLLENLSVLDDCDLVMTDYYLPDFNGVTVTQEVRQYQPEMPVIVLTGSRESFIKDSIAKIPNCHVLYKPLNIEDLESMLGLIFKN